jgi:hypothetical protein
MEQENFRNLLRVPEGEALTAETVLNAFKNIALRNIDITIDELHELIQARDALLSTLGASMSS